MAVLDGKLYAAGGEISWDDEDNEEEDEEDRPLNMLERFNPATNTWVELAPMATLRTNPGVAVL